MKAVTIKQPGASQIAAGDKRIEVRAWRPAYRGPILVCASGRPDNRGPAGCTVAMGVLTAVTPYRPRDAESACEPFTAGKWAWHIEGAKPVPLVRVRGRLRLFDVPRDVARKVASGLDEKPYDEDETADNGGKA